MLVEAKSLRISHGALIHRYNKKAISDYREDLKSKKEFMKLANMTEEDLYDDNVLIESAMEAIYHHMKNAYMLWTGEVIIEKIFKTRNTIIFLQRAIKRVLFDNDEKIL